MWKRFRKWFLGLNPICQLIENGKQCMNFATVVHHRKAVRQHPELFLVASNCVGLCASHHDHREGDTGNEQYVPTNEAVWGTGE
jgi:hypothetical protein